MRTWPHAAAILIAAALTAMACAAQPLRPIDSGGRRVVLGAPASLGGPKSVRGSAGVRFPLLPAGALFAHAAPASAHRPVGKPQAAKPTAKPALMDRGKGARSMHLTSPPYRTAAHAASKSAASHASRHAASIGRSGDQWLVTSGQQQQKR